MKILMPRLHLNEKNGITLGLLFVVAATENFAYLVPASQVLVRPIKFSDIGFLSALLWSFYVFVKCGFISRKISLRGGECFLIPIMYIPIILLSGIVARNFFGQSLTLTLIRNRRIIAAIILFYAIVIALKNRLITKKELVTIIFAQAFVEIIVDCIQFLLADNITIAYYDIGERYESVRVRVAYLLPLIAGYIALGNFIKGKYKLVNGFFSGSALFMLAVICKHRAPTILVLLTIGVAYLLWKKNLSKKIIFGILILIIVIPLIYRLPMIQDAIKTAMSRDIRVNSLIIRNQAREYYFRRLQYSPWFGFGEPYHTIIEASTAAGTMYGFIREDNGVFGFLYAHGIVGLIWLFLLFIGIIKRSVLLYRRKTEYCYLLYFIYEIGNLYMGMHWYYDYQYPFFLMLALLEREYVEVKNEKCMELIKQE